MSSAPEVMAVLAPLPSGKPRGVERVALQALHARYAVRLSAELRGAHLDGLPKSADDVPLPSNGWHWSLSHCASSVAGVVHSEPVGVDVEDRRDVRAEVVARVLSPEEIALFERRGEAGFLRAWTAKEALLKELGRGLGGLSRCRVIAVDDGELTLEFEGALRRIRQHVERDRVASLSVAGEVRAGFLVFADAFPQTPDELRWA